jgi:hypothetical protein
MYIDHGLFNGPWDLNPGQISTDYRKGQAAIQLPDQNGTILKL